MEDSGTFNAGVSSCLTIDKRIEMDASIMDGLDISAGSVGMVQDIKNPIKLARLIMEH
jgi:L-asparaginase / beta-aspartyl-peptidase